MSIPELHDDMALNDSEMPTLQQREKDTDACRELRNFQETGVDADKASIMGQRLLDAALSSWNSPSSCDSDDESDPSDPPFSAELDEFADEEGFESEDVDIPHTGPSSSAFVKQQHIKQEETLTPHPTYAAKVIATLRVPKPDGSGDFVQADEIPEVQGTPASGVNLKRENVYFWPPVLERKMPGRKGGATAWVLDTSNTNTNANIRYMRTLPTGATQTFTPTLILRAFLKSTNAYVKAYLNTSLLASMDPNSRTWSTKYAKWMQQVHSRNDPTWEKTLSRNVWTEAEKEELLACVKDFVAEFGLKALGKRTGVKGAMKNRVFADWANRINAVSGRVDGSGRSKDAVRSAFFKASVLNNAGVFEILQQAERARGEGAGTVYGRDGEGDGEGGGEDEDGEEKVNEEQNLPMQDSPDLDGGRHMTKVTNTPTTGKKRKRAAPAPGIEEEVERDDADAEDQRITTMPPRRKRKMRGPGKEKGKIPAKSKGFGEKTQFVLEKATALVENSSDDGEDGDMGEEGVGDEGMSF